jgi:hypothetical protein
MEEAQPLKPVEDNKDKTEEPMPVPFGMMGVAFLCNILQYAVFLGLTMVVLMLIHYFRLS